MDGSSFHTYNTSVYQYISLLLNDHTTIDLFITSLLDCLNLSIALGNCIQSPLYQVSNKRFLLLRMIQAKIFKIAQNQKLTPHQILIRALYKTVEQLPEATAELRKEKLYYL